MPLRFDPERDCSLISIFQDIRVFARNGTVWIEQYDGSGEEILHCVGIPAWAVPTIVCALQAANDAAVFEGIFSCLKEEFEE